MARVDYQAEVHVYENCDIDEDVGESDGCFCNLVVGRRGKDDEQWTSFVREGIYDMSMTSGFGSSVIHARR